MDPASERGAAGRAAGLVPVMLQLSPGATAGSAGWAPAGRRRDGDCRGGPGLYFTTLPCASPRRLALPCCSSPLYHFVGRARRGGSTAVPIRPRARGTPCRAGTPTACRPTRRYVRFLCGRLRAEFCALHSRLASRPRAPCWARCQIRAGPSPLPTSASASAPPCPAPVRHSPTRLARSCADRAARSVASPIPDESAARLGQDVEDAWRVWRRVVAPLPVPSRGTVPVLRGTCPAVVWRGGCGLLGLRAMQGTKRYQGYSPASEALIEVLRHGCTMGAPCGSSLRSSNGQGGPACRLGRAMGLSVRAEALGEPR